MKYGLIGTGRMGMALARTLSVIPNRPLFWYGRDEMKINELLLTIGTPNLIKANLEEILFADVIIHTLWYRDLIPWLKDHRLELRGKILVDISNPFTTDFTDFVTDWGTSAAEEIQKLVPETAVIGAFKNTFFEVLNQPIHEGLMSDVYVTGDRQDAKDAVIQYLEPLPFRVYDAGGLKNNRIIERMTLFERELAIRYGHYPYVSFHLFGSNH